jgi:hypothetical protein
MFTHHQILQSPVVSAEAEGNRTGIRKYMSRLASISGTIAVWILALFAHGDPAAAANAVLFVDEPSPPLQFALDEVRAALTKGGFSVEQKPLRDLAASVTGGTKETRIIFIDAAEAARRESAPDPAQSEVAKLRAEGFILRRTGKAENRSLWVIGKDAAGSMYGGLELAEQIRLRGAGRIEPVLRNPHFELRGTKFNIPLDLRSPSYSDMGDSAQANIATVWDFEFWRAYLDGLARHRYNMVSLWNLHPFPSMVKVPEYPDVALTDVWRSTIKFDEDYSTRTVDMLSPAMLAQKEVVKRLTIEQKIDFWRRVMRYAKDRNIAVHVITWNIFTYGVDGKYGITDALENPKTVDYFRASVREMFRTYPLLAGIGLTAGENMGEVKMYTGGVDSFDAKENWLLATYGQGVLDAARADPKRDFRLIHRQHESRAQDIATTFKPVVAQPNVEFLFSFKYAQAHVLSATRQTFHAGYLESLGDIKTLWTLRNDDALMYRWGAPDFVREFLGNIPMEKSRGFYYGSDMWVWGREFLSKTPTAPRQLEIDKHWLAFLLWGRLGYDPKLSNERIAGLVGLRFRGVDSKKLLDAWQQASMVYPLVTGFHWADFDFQWYIEGCRSRPGPAKTASGFHSVNTFIDQKVHPGTDNLSIPRYVEAISQGTVPPGTTPLEVAARIDASADAALAAHAVLARQPQATRNQELAATLGDIRTMALLGKYYAAKIRGATQLALFRAHKAPGHQATAIEHLTQALAHWRAYVSEATRSYKNPMWTNRVGIVDWVELTAEVEQDVKIAQAGSQAGS